MLVVIFVMDIFEMLFVFFYCFVMNEFYLDEFNRLNVVFTFIFSM